MLNACPTSRWPRSEDDLAKAVRPSQTTTKGGLDERRSLPDVNTLHDDNTRVNETV